MATELTHVHCSALLWLQWSCTVTHKRGFREVVVQHSFMVAKWTQADFIQLL